MEIQIGTTEQNAFHKYNGDLATYGIFDIKTTPNQKYNICALMSALSKCMEDLSIEFVRGVHSQYTKMYCKAFAKHLNVPLRRITYGFYNIGHSWFRISKGPEIYCNGALTLATVQNTEEEFNLFANQIRDYITKFNIDINNRHGIWEFSTERTSLQCLADMIN